MDFDDIDVPELADSDSDGEEAMSGYVIVKGDKEVNVSDTVLPSSSAGQIDPCFMQSVLLDDEELDDKICSVHFITVC